jgi:adenylate cyclase class 2
MTMRKDVELEIKFLISNLTAMKKRLDELCAGLAQRRLYERNLRFDTSNSDLSREFKILRLRQDIQNSLTYKGPTNIRDGIQERTEIEFTVSDFQAAQRFLEALGYKVCIVYEKYRTNYSIDGVTISLDEMPFGVFIEIEGIFERLNQLLGLIFRDITFVNFSGIECPLDQLSIYPADKTSNT